MLIIKTSGSRAPAPPIVPHYIGVGLATRSTENRRLTMMKDKREIRYEKCFVLVSFVLHEGIQATMRHSMPLPPKAAPKIASRSEEEDSYTTKSHLLRYRHGKHRAGDSDATSCFQQTQWDQLCLIASDSNGHMECKALDQVASGRNNLVRLLEFSDGTRWAARVNIKSQTSGRSELKSEVAAMQFISDYSDLDAVVPEVYAYAFDNDNPAAVAYILMEVLPGIVAMDALGGHKVHRGVIPRWCRPNFYRSVALRHIQMTSLRLPKIGTVVRIRDGIYESGPIPGIGGPFDTAAAFFEAWADSVKFKWNEDTIRRMMQGGPIPAEEMISMIQSFPSRIKAMAGRLSAHNEGPFPLHHADFLHSNIMVDERHFDVTGIIDWEGACTVPWELVAFPDFLQAMPPSFDLPENYDEHGQPIDDDLKETWTWREEYTYMVRSAELKGRMLSSCLASKSWDSMIEL
ncbi:hypothetical protein ACRALDRAFT_211377 [Sodiomyces alcalophilus JCM 7366]|uniref:uncharacterized protein n=1 Tax=Sodiomyces alcalophilus JCM 7366 TaxID=591952 RepID=UPI0039B4C2A5